MATRRGYLAVDGLKKCAKCLMVKDVSNFCFQKSHKDGLASLCRACAKEAFANWKASIPGGINAYGRALHRRNPKVQILSNAKRRAAKYGLECDIVHEDITIPDTCPLLGIPLMVAPIGGRRGPCPNSPTLDRIDSSKGYIRGNVWVISFRANTIKSDAKLSEVERIAANWRSLIEDLTTTERET